MPYLWTDLHAAIGKRNPFHMGGVVYPQLYPAASIGYSGIYCYAYWERLGGNTFATYSVQLENKFEKK